MYLLPMPRVDLLALLPQQGVVAEIGVWRGDFSREIFKKNKPSKFHLIDPWRFIDRDDYRDDPTNSQNKEHEENYQLVKRAFRRHEKKGRAVLHRELSTEAAPQFPDNYFDWIYLDGMHTYEAVKEDLRAFAPKLKNDGLILGHDYTNQKKVQELQFGVVDAVNEFVAEEGYDFFALTTEDYPTYVLVKDAHAENAKSLINKLVRNVRPIIEIRDYPERPFQHKQFEYVDHRNRTKVRLIPSF
ncbi:MAG: class I SAM-dependent methyltransferase [Rhodospirillales bacterium]